MNNNTKVRIRLSKQLFESISQQILAEAKKSKNMSGGVYTEVVKTKKTKSPEVSKTNKMKTMEEAKEKPTMDEAKMKKMEEVRKKVMEVAKKHLADKAMKESTLKEGQSIIIKNDFTLDGKQYKAGERVNTQPNFNNIEAAAKAGKIKATDFKYAVG